MESGILSVAVRAKEHRQPAPFCPERPDRQLPYRSISPLSLCRLKGWSGSISVQTAPNWSIKMLNMLRYLASRPIHFEAVIGPLHRHRFAPSACTEVEADPFKRQSDSGDGSPLSWKQRYAHFYSL
ncbi:MAG: hypothetical protein QOF70_7067 [Acetobacteraceae bacterium]|nr:hypothetical protein [Acetobacteraceae bacterium]